MVTRQQRASRPWYGSRRVAQGRCLVLELGPLSLWLEHREHEWRIAFTSAPDPLADRLEIAERDCGGEGEGKGARHRFATRQPGDAIAMTPRLADRPVLARPEPQLVIPARDEVELFVSTPIWVAVELPDPPRSLLEVPTSRPSDTWFGPDTRWGTLCYASRTAASLLLDNMPLRPHRAITRVLVRNRADDALELERLSVPAPNLSLWADPRGGLWTQSVVAERNRSGVFAISELTAEPPAEAAGGELVSAPREEGTPTVLHRALQVLLG